MGKTTKSITGEHLKERTAGSSNVGGNNSSDIQTWYEVPTIAHFCSVFCKVFDLLEFDIQDLEESFLLMGTKDDTSQLVIRVLVLLLKGCCRSFANKINEDNYNTYLRRLFLSKREEADEDGLENACEFECKALLDEDIDFPDLSLRNRVRILKQLTEYRLDAEDVSEKINNLEPRSLRIDPMGKDSDNVVYWYFYGTRLYKDESMNKNHKDYKKNRAAERKKKKQLEKSDEDASHSMWSTACLTLNDWEALADKYKMSNKRCEKQLYDALTVDFLPEITKMFAEKERLEKRRQLMMAPKRTSSRIERKRSEQKEKDLLLVIKLEEERRLKEEYDEKVHLERMKREEEEREFARQERIRERDVMKENRAKRARERDYSNETIALPQQEENNLTYKTMRLRL